MRTAKPPLRKGPRVTICLDFNLQWLWPKVAFQKGLGYFHLGWLSGMVGFGKGRDTFYDALDRGIGLKRDK